jgi:hypothetical protein
MGSSLILSAFDVKAWYLAQGGSWVCGQRYRVTLTVDTECSIAESVDKIITIDCCEAGEGGGQDCCKDHKLKIIVPNSPMGQTDQPGVYSFAAAASWVGPSNRLEVTLANVVRALPPTALQMPSFGFIEPANALLATPPLAPVIPMLLFPRVVRWQSLTGSSSGTGIYVPLTMHFSPPPQGQVSYLKFTLKFKSYKNAPGNDCSTCEASEVFHFRIDGEGRPTHIAASQWPQETVPKGDTNNPWLQGLGRGIPPDLENTANRGGVGGALRDPRLQGLGRVNPPLDPKNRASRGTGGIAQRPVLSAVPLTPLVWPPTPQPTPHSLVCCPEGQGRVAKADLRMLAVPPVTAAWAGYAFSPVLTAPPGKLVGKVEIAMINAAAALSNGPTYPIFGWINSVSAPGGLPYVPQLAASPFSHIAQYVYPPGQGGWTGSFPMMCTFPTPPPGKPLFVHFTMRYSFVSTQCSQCDLYEKYYFKLEHGKNPVPIDPKNWPVKSDRDTGDPPPNKRGDGGTLKRGGGG